MVVAQVVYIDDFDIFTVVDNGTCSQPKFPGTCRGMFMRYYYNKETNSCQMFIYGGCNANANNFEKKEECEKKCMKNSGLYFCKIGIDS